MKLAILDKVSFGEDTPVEKLQSFGELITYDSTSPEEIIDRVRDVDVIITNKVKIGEEIMACAKKLKLICVFATGYDNIDVVAAKKRGIGVCNVPAYSVESVTLFTVSTALALYSKLFEYRQFVTSGEYSKSAVPNRLIPVYHELRGRKWGIVGCGNIGRAVAKVAQSFGMEVLVYTRTPNPNYNCVDIETLCKESDIISLHCPLNDKTRSLIGEKEIDVMKKDVVLVNEARGAVVNEHAVAMAILNGRIGAFGCDVYSIEPFDQSHPYNKIMNLSNVILTPHAAWGAYEARVRCVDIITENITSFFNGEVKNRVDLE